jgi:C-terminal processing protease CtpA/Prc
MSAADELEYHLLVREFTARINDSHAFLQSQVLTDYFGRFFPPFRCRHIQGETVITQVYEGLLENPGEIEEGDIVLQLDGIDIKTLRQNLRKFMAASNEVTKERNINSYLFMDEDKPFELLINRGNQELKVSLNRFSQEEIILQLQNQAGIIWKYLPGDIGYVNMGELDMAEANRIVTKLSDTKAIIFDIRNYPQGTMYAICEDLLPQAVLFVIFTKPNLSNPGTFLWSNALYAGPNGYNEEYYKGKVVLLLDERTQSHAEFTCMALQTAPDVTLIGSQTAGADGNVSHVSLPGGIKVYFSGIGVFYPDKTPTQRIGIVPDIVVSPTIEGIRQGRDEVLEAAVSFIHNNQKDSR